MDAVVLAAGPGTRMAPLCAQTPKPLLPIAGRTLLERTLAGLAAAGIPRVVIVVGPDAAPIEAHARSHAPADLELEFVPQGKSLGTGHGVAAAVPFVSGDALVVAADRLVDPTTFQALARSDGFTVATTPVTDPRRHDVLMVQDGRVVAHTKGPDGPAGDHADTGIYRVPAAALVQCLEPRPGPHSEHEFTDVLAKWIHRGEVHAVAATGWHHVATPWAYLAAHEAILPTELAGAIHADRHGGPGHVEDGVTIHGRLWVEPGAIVRAGTYIHGDAWIGRNAEVGPSAHLRGAVALGPGARVGAGTEIKTSILLAGAQAPHHNYVGDSVLGHDCDLGSGTKIANLKHTGTTVRTDWDGTVVDTGRRSFGAVVGDGAKTGVNVSLQPGTVLGAGAWVGAGKVVGSWVETGKRLL